MSNSLISAPGKSLEEFLKELAFDLRKRKIEYLNVGLFNKDFEPIGMLEIKGHSSWVEFDQNKIIELARKYKAYGICFLHNHPCSAKESPYLIPSENDIQALKKILKTIENNDLNFLGSWITSNSHLTEIFNYCVNNSFIVNKESYFDESDKDTFLTPYLRQSYENLTKSDLTQTSFFTLFTEYLSRNKFSFSIVRARYYGKSFASYSFSIEVEDLEENTYNARLTIEEALRASDSIKELMIAIEETKITKDEFTQLRIDLSKNMSCIAYKSIDERNAVIEVNGHNIFLKIKDLETLLRFFEVGFEKIENLINEESTDESLC